MHLKVAFNWDTKPLYDVIARLAGSTFPDEWIIRGNHHDAWVNGAADPVSGMAPELEEARALGELAKQGWPPKRTIVYAAWDGEEPALLGSTEWVEQHDDELREKRGRLHQQRRQRPRLPQRERLALARALRQRGGAQRPGSGDEAARSGSGWQARQIAQGRADERNESRDARRPAHRRARLRAPTTRPFLQHAGIASLNLVFGGVDEDGIYHSIYDDFYHFTKFSDPGFLYGRALAQTVGTAVIRLADADVLPFEFTGLADTVQTYVTELQDLLKQRQDEVHERNRQIDDGVFAAVERSEAAAADSDRWKPCRRRSTSRRSKTPPPR